MLRRLLVIVVPLAVLLVAALGVPLAIATAQRETQQTYVDRLNDVGRFASLAETALARGRTEALDTELRRYHQLYDIPVALLDPAGETVLDAGVDERAAWSIGPADQEVVAQALAGYRPEPPGVVWPWSDSPMVIAEPIGRDSELVGVVAMASPTDRLRSDTLTNWSWLALLGVAAMGVLFALAWLASRWVVRPVRQLDDAAAAIAAGDLGVRARSSGPPELRGLADSFNTMVDVVERALQRQRAFVSDASHQLRNPLASLRLAVENLGPHLSGREALETHDVAIEEAKAMHRMLNSLLAATRLDSFKRAEPVDLDSVLDTRAERWRALADASGLEFQLEVPPGLRVLEPPGGLGSVLDELVSNALRLSGGSRVELRATHDPADPAMVELAVGDDGVGLDPDERSAALGRFWRAPRHQNTIGTGLGLAICAELVRAAGGDLRLRPGLPRSRSDCDGVGAGVGADRGLAAIVSLPLAPIDDPGTQQVSRNERTAEPA